MGKTTAENFRKLEKAEEYDEAKLKGLDYGEFTTALGCLINKKKIPTIKIVENSNISKSYINKLRNPSEKGVRPGRYVIIDIALAIDATLEETHHLLKLARYQEHYTRDKAESVIIWGMLHKLTGKEIRRMLESKGLDGVFKDK